MEVKWHPSELEVIPCNTCGAKGEIHNVLIRRDGVNVVQCRVCGLAYVSPRPKREYIEKFYDSDYFTGQGSDSGIGYRQDYYASLETFVPQQLRHILRTCGIEDLSGMEVLEVGCATGRTLAKLQEEGAHVLGIEPVESAARIAREHFRVPVLHSSFEDACLGTRTFDLVIALDVLEHVPSPRAFLEKCHGVLPPGGLVIICTPNYGAAKQAGSKWKGFHESLEHLYFFDRDSLGRMAKECGFAEARVAYHARVHLPRTPQRVRQMLGLIPGLMQAAGGMKGLLTRVMTRLRENAGSAEHLWVALEKE